MQLYITKLFEYKQVPPSNPLDQLFYDPLSLEAEVLIHILNIMVHKGTDEKILRLVTSILQNHHFTYKETVRPPTVPGILIEDESGGVVLVFNKKAITVFSKTLVLKCGAFISELKEMLALNEYVSSKNKVDAYVDSCLVNPNSYEASVIRDIVAIELKYLRAKKSHSYEPKKEILNYLNTNHIFYVKNEVGYYSNFGSLINIKFDGLKLVQVGVCIEFSDQVNIHIFEDKSVLSKNILLNTLKGL